MQPENATKNPPAPRIVSPYVGSIATLLATLIAAFFSIYGFYSALTLTSSIYMHNAEAAVAAGIDTILFAFGCTGSYFTWKRSHFHLALTGAFLVLASFGVETILLNYLSPPIPTALNYKSPIAAYTPLLIIQILISLTGVVFTLSSAKHFTS